VTEELRHVGGQNARLFEPGRRFVTKIAKLQSLEAGGFARVFPCGANRRDSLPEPVSEDICAPRF
jgi:hypothetical protein